MLSSFHDYFLERHTNLYRLPVTVKIYSFTKIVTNNKNREKAQARISLETPFDMNSINIYQSGILLIAGRPLYMLAVGGRPNYMVAGRPNYLLCYANCMWKTYLYISCSWKTHFMVAVVVRPNYMVAGRPNYLLELGFIYMAVGKSIPFSNAGKTK
ncbi:hypothetical protein CEXT_390671 [Caerostris extrusa]|uniref:Uncharacterized protein n=1 Tax=Caerostris extrusa TaxID=172846 RepID=A0AAV4W1I4_CAEEX|nr:hypothetical protein CEXT_390671 [Caerostris extrusa]